MHRMLNSPEVAGGDTVVKSGMGAPVEEKTKEKNHFNSLIHQGLSETGKPAKISIKTEN